MSQPTQAQDREALEADVQRAGERVSTLLERLESVVLGQNDMLRKILAGLLAGGHILLEGVPGLAKTLAATTVARSIDASYRRIQFMPDLLPADLVGTLIYDQQRGQFTTRKGPIFANLILADEINRAPSKVQSALLECMQEKQVTIGDETFELDKLFLVLATENPIEQEGTYPLPEAQVDRFMLKVKVDYPDRETELRIIRMEVEDHRPKIDPMLSPEEVLSMQALVRKVYVDDAILRYVVDIANATRFPADYRIDPELISNGVSPRASIFLVHGAKARALMEGRWYVNPDDVRWIGREVMRHRLVLSYEAEAERVDPDEVIERIFDSVDIP